MVKALDFFFSIGSILFFSSETPSSDPSDLIKDNHPPLADLSKFDLRADVLRMALFVSFFALILWVLTRILQQWTSQREGQINDLCKIKLLEKRVLGPKTALYLLQIPGKQVLIAQTPTSLKAVSETTCSLSEEEINAQLIEASNGQKPIAKKDFWSKWSIGKN